MVMDSSSSGARAQMSPLSHKSSGDGVLATEKQTYAEGK